MKRKPKTTKPKSAKPKNGRPLADINPAVVESMAMHGYSKRMTAAMLGVSEDTIHRRFAALFADGIEKGKACILEEIWKKVTGGDSTMIVFAAKNRLGWADRTEVKQTSTGELRVIGENPVEMFTAAAERAKSYQSQK